MLISDAYLRIKILLLVLFFEGGIQVHGNGGCFSTQYVELGRQGYIICTFSTQPSEVYWYDDVSGGSDVLAIASYRVQANVKGGSGIESGEYDILSNGTLVITNVTVGHEKQYKVLACTQRCNPLPTISVKVVVYPRTPTPSVASCNDESPCTVSVTKTGHPICQVDKARPPLHLQWVEQISGKDIPVERQVNFSELNSDGVTYKSIAVFNETINTERLLAVYTCKPTWIITGLVKEKKILLDYSEETDPLNPTSKETVYYEIYRRAELRCKVSNFSAIIWRKVSSSGKAKTIGSLFEDYIHTNGEFSDDVILSSDGSLIFTSIQLQHEGTYACIYDDGKDVKGIHTRYLQVLVPPSPPYIKIQECQKDDPCIFRGNRSGLLSCVIHGVRPEVTLTWIGTNDELVTLHDDRTVIQKRRQLTDVSVSVRYELAYDIVCETPVELRCQVGHPISQIIQPHATVVIYAGPCPDQDDGGNGMRSTSPSVVVIIAVAAVCSPFIVLFTCCLTMKYFRRNERTENQQSIDFAGEDASYMLKQPNGHDVETSECIDNEKHAENEQKKNENKIPLTAVGMEPVCIRQNENKIPLTAVGMEPVCIRQDENKIPLTAVGMEPVCIRQDENKIPLTAVGMEPVCIRQDENKIPLTAVGMEPVCIRQDENKIPLTAVGMEPVCIRQVSCACS